MDHETRQHLLRIDEKLNGLIALTLERTTCIMSAIDDLEAKVTAEETVEASAITLLQSLSQELKDALANDDTARIEALSAKLDSDTSALAAAVTANTPAASEAPAENEQPDPATPNPDASASTGEPVVPAGTSDAIAAATDASNPGVAEPEPGVAEAVNAAPDSTAPDTTN